MVEDGGHLVSLPYVLVTVYMFSLLCVGLFRRVGFYFLRLF